MKKFVFRLETPLKLRRRKVDRASQELARARGEEFRVRREIARLEQERASWNQPPTANAAGEIDWARHQRRQEYVDALNDLIVSQKESLGPLVEKVAACERALQTAVRERQILERLKEIRHRSFVEELKVLETKRTDFVASATFRRNAHE